MKILLGLLFTLGVLAATSANAATVNCSDVKAVCVSEGICPRERDIGPADDCKATDNKTCCQTTTPAPTVTPTTTKPTAPAASTAPKGYGLINPLGNRTIPQIIGQLIAWLGAIGGSLFFGYLLWGGVEWMTAAGSNERVESGRKKIIASVSGIVVILLAYLIIESLIGVITFR